MIKLMLQHYKSLALIALLVVNRAGSPNDDDIKDRFVVGMGTDKTSVKSYRNLCGMHDYIVTQVRKSIKK